MIANGLKNMYDISVCCFKIQKMWGGGGGGWMDFATYRTYGIIPTKLCAIGKKHEVMVIPTRVLENCNWFKQNPWGEGAHDIAVYSCTPLGRWGRGNQCTIWVQLAGPNCTKLVAGCRRWVGGGTQRRPILDVAFHEDVTKQWAHNPNLHWNSTIKL